MKILSLFDGISGAAQALKELGIDCEYHASEIDKHAIKIAKKNHPEIKHLGDVNSVNFSDFIGIDLLIGGFPCQSFSGAGKRKSFEDIRGQLFFKCLEALTICKPKFFLFENVASMKSADQDFISEKLGVKPIMINSNLLTAQNRKRLYWTNLKVEQPENNGQLLKDILQEISELPEGIRVGGLGSPLGSKQIWDSPFMVQIARGKNRGGIKALDGKTPTLSSSSFQHNNHVQQGRDLRRLTPIECERLQGFPDNYSQNISNLQRYKALGNSFTVPVIKHILKNINLVPAVREVEQVEAIKI